MTRADNRVDRLTRLDEFLSHPADLVDRDRETKADAAALPAAVNRTGAERGYG